MSNMIGSFGRANLALAGLGVGIGILVMGGRSMIEVSEKHQAATAGLEQAYKATGTSLTRYQRNIDDFIMSSRRYVSDQSEVIDGFAKLTRSGLTQTEVQKDMSRAVDLAAIKHISLSEAVDLLQKAEAGRMRGLIDLGISTSKFTDANGNLIPAMHSVKQAMAELDVKLKGGRDTLTSLQQSSNTLSNDWQDLANRGGPVLISAIDGAVKKVDELYQSFDRIGKDDKLWSQISDRLVDMAKWIKQYVLDPLGRALDWLKDIGGRYMALRGEGSATVASGTAAFGQSGRAGGGSLLPNSVYTVGEQGPETVVMGPRGTGGTVIPNDGTSPSGSPIHYHLTLNGSSAVNDPEGVRRMLQRMQLLGAAG